MRVIVTGGGTGGHLFPGIAVAEAILTRIPGSKIMFIGTDRQLDSNALAGRPFAAAAIRCQGLKGRSLPARLGALLQLPPALLAAMRHIRGFRPDLVFGVGGYVTGPVILAARLLGVPTCIHEQNSIPGIANRVLGRLADRIFISIPGSEKFFPARKTVLSGNPVRQELLAAAGSANRRPADLKTGACTLLVLGGSQGARMVNRLILEGLRTHLHDLPAGLRIIHQTGRDDELPVRQQYESLGLEARVAAFFQNMAELYLEADLVVSRAGATTLAELTIFRKPAILIPYPYAADNHQEENGRCLLHEGGAVLFRQSELDGDRLGREIIRLLKNPELLRQMAAGAGRLAKPAAAEFIVDECLALLGT